MFKFKFRSFILNNWITRELFFFIKNKKADIKAIDRAIEKDNVRLSTTKVNNLIVSLTSYGERISNLKYTLYSLVSQSVCPEKIIVNLAFEDKKYLNDEIKYFDKYGVEFNFCEDIRSFKKLVPTLKRYPDKVIVTADDDLYFSCSWLEKLWSEHIKFKNDIICHLAYKITYNNNSLLSYTEWVHSPRIKNYDKSIFLLGGAGCLYPPYCLLNDVVKEEIFSKLTPYADDIWFYFMAVLNKTKIRQIEKNPEVNLCYTDPYREYGITKGSSLTQINVGKGQNDKQIKAVLDYYNIPEEKFVQFLKGNIDSLN